MPKTRKLETREIRHDDAAVITLAAKAILAFILGMVIVLAL